MKKYKLQSASTQLKEKLKAEAERARKAAVKETVQQENKQMGYKKVKVRRDFLRTFMLYPCKYYKENHMTNTLALLSEAIGVGFFKGEYDCPFDTANCYININRLMKIWDIYSPAKCLEELDLLKKWGVLNYSFGVDVNRHRQIRVYIKFKMFTQYLCNNITSRESKGYQEQRYNINNFDGYFWVDAEQMAEFFFKKHKYPHGIKDLATLLYFNVSFGDKMCPYDELRFHPIVTFGKMCGIDKEKKDPDSLVVAPNYYIKQQDLADFLKIPISATRNMVQRLEREGLIHTKYIRNKGMCIIFRCQENSNVEEIFENIQKAIYSLKETRKKPARGIESFCGLGVKFKLFYIYFQQAVKYIQEQRNKYNNRRRNHINRKQNLVSCLADVPMFIELRERTNNFPFGENQGGWGSSFDKLRSRAHRVDILTDADDDYIDGVHDDLPF